MLFRKRRRTSWGDGVVPVAMEFVGFEVDGGESVVADLDAGFVGVLVELREDLQTLGRWSRR